MMNLRIYLQEYLIDNYTGKSDIFIYICIYILLMVQWSEVMNYLRDTGQDLGKDGAKMGETELAKLSQALVRSGKYNTLEEFKAALKDSGLNGLKAGLTDDFRAAIGDVGKGAKDGAGDIHIHNIMQARSEMSAAEKDAANTGLKGAVPGFLKDQGISVKNVAIGGMIFLFGDRILTMVNTRSEADCQKACMQQQQIAPDGTNVDDVGGWGPMCPLEKTTKAECAVYCSTTKPGACSLEERDKRGGDKCAGMEKVTCMLNAGDSLMDQVSKFWDTWGFRIQMALFVLFGLCMLHYVVGLGKDLFGRGVSSAKSTFTYARKNKAEVGAGYRKKMGKRK